jgi:hypothetical protein
MSTIDPLRITLLLMKLHTESSRARNLTAGRNLIPGAIIDIVTAVLGETSVRKLSSVPLSNDTVCYQIGDTGRF